MADIEPVESGDKGVSIWVVIAVVVGSLILGGVPLWYLLNNVVGSETTTTVPEAAVITTSSPTTSSVTEPTSTMTSQPVVTTTAPPQTDENPFIGWWKAVDSDGSYGSAVIRGARHSDLRVDAEGGFSYWDSASDLCVNGDVSSPQIWEGITTLKPVGTPTLAATGTAICQFYGIGHQEGKDLIFAFYYHADMDVVEFAGNGAHYVRSPSVPGIPGDDANPFVGSWEGTDGDLTHVEMMILGDGSWRSTDTRSAGCERKGFTYGTWSGEGSGTFDLSGTPTFDVALTTYCHPVGEEKLVHSPEVNFIFSYEESTDTVVLQDAGTIYTRLP